jgi:glycosyltransferase involved in cell wall biosynthesis
MAQRVICVMGRVLDQEDGLQVYASNLLHHMIAADTSSRYIILLRTARQASLFGKFPHVETQIIPARIKTYWDQVAVPLAARRVRADIIFNPKFSLPFLSRHPCLFVLHGSDWYVNPGNYTWWDNLYIRLVLPLYCYKATHLLAISQCVVGDLVRHASIDASKVTVTYAAPSPHFSPRIEEKSRRDFAASYRLPERFILAVARVYHSGHGRLPPYPGGNVEGLVHGYQRYRDNGGELPLVIAGKDIDRYLQARGFSDRELQGIHYSGFVPHDKIVMLYNLAEFFVLTTLYESFSFPLVEAMASGCPVIASSTGACPEVAGNAARLVDPYDSVAIGDTMTELARSPRLREQMRAAGLERVRTFSWQWTAARTLEVFEKLSPTCRLS